MNPSSTGKASLGKVGGPCKSEISVGISASACTPIGTQIVPGTTFDISKDLIELKGKVVIVTGGNRGIGYSTVKHFARAGAKVYLASRDDKAASDAIVHLKSEGLEPGNGEVAWLRLDQSDPRDAKKSAEEFLKLESRLDILVLNAAITRGDFALSADGISTMVVVNYISPFIFTNTLLPLMEETARQPDSDVRIVNVSSMVIRNFPTNGLQFKKTEDLNMEFKGSLMDTIYRYAHSKLLGVMWVRTLQKRFDEANPSIPITVIAAHPGAVKTFINDTNVPLVWRWLTRLFGVEVDIGTYNSLFSGASKQVAQQGDKYKGAYIEPVGKVMIPPAVATNEDNAKDLWKTTEEFLQRIGVQ